MWKGAIQAIIGFLLILWGVYQLFGRIGLQWLFFIVFTLYGIILIILGGINLYEEKEKRTTEEKRDIENRNENNKI